MSASWTERQGQLADLRHHSRAQLQELLLRQQKILSNKRLLQTLPDKGEKTREFAERVRLAIEHHDEEEKKQRLASAAREELQSKYQQTFTMKQHAIQNASAARQCETVADSLVLEKKVSPVSIQVQENCTLNEQQDRVAPDETMEIAAAGASLNPVGTKEGDLVEALERVRLTETASTGSSSETKGPFKSSARDNYFLTKQMPKKPHSVAVLERSSSGSGKQKFQPNKLPYRSDNPPSQLSAQARREQDKKHLDDITAAKLPPLHHSPAQTLSLQESATLLTEQIKKQQELQAKLAAQKLSERLKISMESYTPDGGPMASYREVHDEGAQLSSEED